MMICMCNLWFGNGPLRRADMEKVMFPFQNCTFSQILANCAVHSDQPPQNATAMDWKSIKASQSILMAFMNYVAMD